MQPEAIRHALAAKDFERAAGLIELAWAMMDVNAQSKTWLGWAKALPEELIRARPVLSFGVAWALLDGGELEVCESWLQDAEQWLAPTDKRPKALQMVMTDDLQFRSLPGSIFTARAYRSMALGDIAATVQFSQQALELAPEEDQLRRTQAMALLGLAQYASGDLEGADHSLSKFQASMRLAGEISVAISIAFTLAEIKAVRGYLREALDIYRQALQLATSE